MGLKGEGEEERNVRGYADASGDECNFVILGEHGGYLRLRFVTVDFVFYCCCEMTVLIDCRWSLSFTCFPSEP